MPIASSADDRPSGRLKAQAGAIIAACLLLGGIAGAVAGGLSSSRYTVKALVRVSPDPTADGSSTGLSADQLTDFVQGELLTLNSPSLRAEARRSSGVQDADLSATQQGNTSVVLVQAIAGQPTDASRAATAALQIYQARRISEVQKSAQSSLSTISSQITTVRNSLANLKADPGSAQASALTSELSRLLTANNQLQLQVSQAGQTVVTLQPAAAADATKTSSTSTYALYGILLGLVIGLALALVRLRLAPARLLVSDVQGEVPGVPLVEFPRISGPATLAVTAETASRRVPVPVQSLHRRLAGRHSAFGRPPLLVVGERPGAGASYLAVELAIASAQIGPTILVNAGDVLDNAINRAFGVVPPEPTVLDALDASDPVSSVSALLSSTPLPKLKLLSIGAKGSDGMEAIERAPAAGLVKILGLLDAAVIIDSPPLSHSSFALDVARDAGAVTLVINVMGSSRRALGEAAEALFAVRPDIELLVLNRPRGRGPIHRR